MDLHEFQNTAFASAFCEDGFSILQKSKVCTWLLIRIGDGNSDEMLLLVPVLKS